MLKKKGLVLTMAATLVLGSVMTVSAADVSTPEEPIQEERLINYPASAQLSDIFGNVYSVNGYCTELVNGSSATTYFGIVSYAKDSTPNEQAELDRLAKRVQVGGGVFYSDFSTTNFSTKSRTWNANGGDITTSITSSKSELEIAGDHRVELSYCGAWWADVSEMSIY